MAPEAVILYASRTGTVSTLEAMRAHGWRILISATGCHRSEGFRYCLDNGAWTAHQKGEPFDPGPFRALLQSHGADADWCAVPDVVCGGLDSLRFSMGWLDEVACSTPMPLIPVQNGMTPADLRPIVGQDVGLFIGGDDHWKESTAPMWGDLAAERGCWLHMGRVNTRRRFEIAARCGVDSTDGTSGILFPCNIPKITKWARDAQEVADASCTLFGRH